MINAIMWYIDIAHLQHPLMYLIGIFDNISAIYHHHLYCMLLTRCKLKPLTWS